MDKRPCRSLRDWGTSQWLRPSKWSPNRRSLQPRLPQSKRNTRSSLRNRCRRPSCRTRKMKAVSAFFVLSLTPLSLCLLYFLYVLFTFLFDFVSTYQGMTCWIRVCTRTMPLMPMAMSSKHMTTTIMPSCLAMKGPLLVVSFFL